MNNTDTLIDSLCDNADAITPAQHPARMCMGWLIAITLYIFAFIGMVGIRVDLAIMLQEPLFIAEISAVILIIISSAVAASLGAFPDRARSRLATWAPLIPLSALLGIIIFDFVSTFSLPNARHLGEMGCMGWMCILSVLPIAGLFLLLSRGFCLYRTAYAYAALASVMTAYFCLRLEEEHITPLHLILFHILPMAGVIGVATIIARLEIFTPLQRHEHN
jgi:hypothetical protein